MQRNGPDAWKDGVFTFDDATLADVVTELNRYSRTHIEIGDAAIGSIKLAGRFNVNKVDEFLDWLQDSAQKMSRTIRITRIPATQGPEKIWISEDPPPG